MVGPSPQSPERGSRKQRFDGCLNLIKGADDNAITQRIKPKIEEARKQERERLVNWLKEGAAKIGNAGGRWSIVDWDKKDYLEITVSTTPADWEALKSTKGNKG